MREQIEMALDAANKPNKKTISINLDTGLIEQIGWVMAGYMELGRNCTRSELIREAITAYITEAEKIVAERLSESEGGGENE